VVWVLDSANTSIEINSAVLNAITETDVRISELGGDVQHIIFSDGVSGCDMSHALCPPPPLGTGTCSCTSLLDDCSSGERLHYLGLGASPQVNSIWRPALAALDDTVKQLLQPNRPTLFWLMWAKQETEYSFEPTEYDADWFVGGLSCTESCAGTGSCGDAMNVARCQATPMFASLLEQRPGPYLDLCNVTPEQVEVELPRQMLEFLSPPGCVLGELSDSE
jgi:hypothetical protein